MKSTLSMKDVALALVVFFIGASLLYYLVLYRPKINKVARGTTEVSSLKGKVEKTMLELKRARGEIERANKEEVNVDYFKRHHIPPEQRTPTFLGTVNDVVNQLRIKTIRVKPEAQEESPEYIRYPFLVETKSKYGEIVKFVDSLENSLGLNLNDLHIQNDPKDPLWHRLKFTVSTFELKRAESPVPPEPPEGGTPPFGVTVRDDISVERDPFLEREKKEFITAAIPRRSPKTLPPMKLDGIIDIAGKKVAIINGTVVREGDWISKHRILRIAEEEVIAIYRGKERILKIEDLVKTQKR